jgi:hypothetical protein
MVRNPTATSAALLAALMATVLGGCGDSNEATQTAHEPTLEELEAVWQEAHPIIERELAKEDARSAARFPCTLFDKEAASALLNANLEAPTFAHEFKNLSNLDTGNHFSWEAEACSWNNWGDGASMNVWVSKPEHFADGRVSCIGIDDDDITEALLGGKAEWEFLESFAWAKLLVCRDDGLFFVEVHDGPADEGEAKSISVEIASRIAETL